jgi:hypothetical protein
MIVRYKF